MTAVCFGPGGNTQDDLQITVQCELEGTANAEDASSSQTSDAKVFETHEHSNSTANLSVGADGTAIGFQNRTCKFMYVIIES